MVSVLVCGVFVSFLFFFFFFLSLEEEQADLTVTVILFDQSIYMCFVDFWFE